MKKLILGSNSPRRRRILEMAGYQFEVMVTDRDEVADPAWTIEETPVELARQKAGHILPDIAAGDFLLLTADTVVVLEKEIIGKPLDLEEAGSILRRLSGKSHTVISGVYMTDGSNETAFSDRTRVHFSEMTDATIRYYLENFTVLDKAGAYAIQEGIGLSHVDGIEGSFYNVMGLPIHKVCQALAAWKVFPVPGSGD